MQPTGRRLPTPVLFLKRKSIWIVVTVERGGTPHDVTFCSLQKEMNAEFANSNQVMKALHYQERATSELIPQNIFFTVRDVCGFLFWSVAYFWVLDTHLN